MIYKSPLVWLRFFRRKTSPLMTIAIASSKVIYLCGTEQKREKNRLAVALAKIDFVKFYAFINDLLW